MRFFYKLFKPKDRYILPQIQFGRLHEPVKSTSKFLLWEESSEDFNNEKYLLSYRKLLEFLSSESQQNVKYHTHKDKIVFSIYQGSKIISGFANFNKLVAEAKIVKIKAPSERLFLYLLEENYKFKYARFAIDADKNIMLKFDTLVEDGSPNKVYEALKELSMEADKKDDWLMHTFPQVEPINHTIHRAVSDEEKQIKFQFFKNVISQVLHEVDHGNLNGENFPGAKSFLLLDAIYKLDFLIKPEGRIMDSIQQIHGLYFNDHLMNVHEKNNHIVQYFRSFMDISYDDFSKEIYEVNITFGKSLPEGHQRLVEIIDAQMLDLQWYSDHGYPQYSKAIGGYVIGFSLYSYDLPELDQALLLLYFQIIENDFFAALGIKNNFVEANVLHKKNIITAVKEIKKVFVNPEIMMSTPEKCLQFDDMHHFIKSYLMMVRNIQYLLKEND